MHASWQPTGAVPSRFRPHFGGFPTSKSMLPCRRELDFQESCFFGAEFEKGLQKRPRSTSKRSRGVPRSARRRPRNFPVEGPGAPRGSKGGRLASRTSPQGLGQAWRLHFGSVLEPFSGHCRSQRTLVRRMSGSPNDYGEGIQDDDGTSKRGETTQASENTGGGQVEHGTCHLPVRPLRAQRPEQGQSQTETEAVTEAQTTRP